MAQRIDWKSMPHAEFVELGEQWASERDERVRALQSADKPTRRMRNGNGASDSTEVV